MYIRLKLCSLACGAALGSAMILAAQTVSDADKKFVKEALQGGNDEVQLGKLAQEKGSSADVKSFGEKMVTDHTQVGLRHGGALPRLAAGGRRAVDRRLDAIWNQHE